MTTFTRQAQLPVVQRLVCYSALALVTQNDLAKSSDSDHRQEYVFAEFVCPCTREIIVEREIRYTVENSLVADVTFSIV